MKEWKAWSIIMQLYRALSCASDIQNLCEHKQIDIEQALDSLNNISI